MIEIFFPTKDRNEELTKCLESIFKFHNKIKISIANCSTDTESTSKILQKFNVNEIILSPDPGMNPAFNILLKNLTEPTAIWLSDDVVLLKSLEEVYNLLVKNNLDALGVGFLDQIHFDSPVWPVDEFKCAKWLHENIRVAHFAMCKSSILKNINLSNYAIDQHLFNMLGNSPTYKYLETEPFLEHNRYMDDTRKNRKL